jgi:D-tyrosyl-tRNA(Tyr) deacylase
MMAEKVATLRLFEDATGKMACDVKEASGQVLIVPQFTLYGDVRRGRRPSFADAAQPDIALQLYELVVLELRTRGLSVATGRFRAMMQVHAVVDGPVTVLIDSEKVF